MGSEASPIVGPAAMGDAPPSHASLDDARARAQALLADRPATARRQAEAILDAVPGHPQALLILGAAHRGLGDAAAAAAVLRPLDLGKKFCDRRPKMASATRLWVARWSRHDRPFRPLLPRRSRRSDWAGLAAVALTNDRRRIATSPE